MEFDKNDRMLEILIRCLRGERISPKKLAEEYGVSTKSISRDISRMPMPLAYISKILLTIGAVSGFGTSCLGSLGFFI